LFAEVLSVFRQNKLNRNNYTRVFRIVWLPRFGARKCCKIQFAEKTKTKQAVHKSVILRVGISAIHKL